MRKIHNVLMLIFIVLLFSCNVVRNTNKDSVEHVKVHLDIPPRRQWINKNGYCGASSIQQIALYYGAYISQDICRKTIGDKEILLYKNEAEVLDALSFTYDRWNNIRPSPQYKDHLVWIKKHLNNGSPVIITTYMRGLSYEGYDHIMAAIGYESSDVSKFNNNDVLIFNDCLYNKNMYYKFSEVWNTRDVQTSNIKNMYGIPDDHNFACAVTGIKDDHGVTLPVHLSVDSWTEPNVACGSKPIKFNGTAKISNLETGCEYILLRYDDYKKVPSKNFTPKEADKVFRFRASGETHNINDTFMSGSVAIYRCIKG